MTGGRPPCLPLRAAVSSPFQRRLPDVLPLGLRHRGEEREQQLSRPGGVVDAGQGSGQHLQHQAVGGEVVGERGQFSSVPAEVLHLVDGEDDPAVRGVGLDLAGEGERGLELGADADAGADLLGEHLVARDALLGEGVELGLEFLGER